MIILKQIDSILPCSFWTSFPGSFLVLPQKRPRETGPRGRCWRLFRDRLQMKSELIRTRSVPKLESWRWPCDAFLLTCVRKLYALYHWISRVGKVKMCLWNHFSCRMSKDLMANMKVCFSSEFGVTQVSFEWVSINSTLSSIFNSVMLCLKMACFSLSSKWPGSMGQKRKMTEGAWVEFKKKACVLGKMARLHHAVCLWSEFIYTVFKCKPKILCQI